jgi:S1-C subfamily serine protease
MLESACRAEMAISREAYGECIDENWALYQQGPEIPDLSEWTHDIAQMLERACAAARWQQGPARYARCLHGQIERYREAPRPDLSSLDPSMHARIELICSGARANAGPAAYATCLNQQTEEQAGRSKRGALDAPPQDRAGDGVVEVTLPQLPAASTRGMTHLNWPNWAGERPAIPGPRQGHDLSAREVLKQVAAAIHIVVAAENEADFSQPGAKTSQGSAVAISRELALTNCHVIVGKPAIVLVQDGNVVRATLDSADPDSDRCILRVFEAKLRAVAGVRAPSELQIGERAFTIGAPGGVERAVAEGQITGLRDRAGVRTVQTSADIAPGSSGGGLFDGRGNLIGITTFKLLDGPNLNFAIAATEFWR